MIKMNKTKEKLMTFRLPIEIDIEIERLAKLEDSDKSKLIRELIVLGMKERKLEEALDLYSKRKVTAWKAATIAGIPLTQFLDILKERGLEFDYTEEELLEDFEGL